LRRIEGLGQESSKWVTLRWSGCLANQHRERESINATFTCVPLDSKLKSFLLHTSILQLKMIMEPTLTFISFYSDQPFSWLTDVKPLSGYGSFIFLLRSRFFFHGTFLKNESQWNVFKKK